MKHGPKSLAGAIHPKVSGRYLVSPQNPHSISAPLWSDDLGSWRERYLRRSLASCISIFLLVVSAWRAHLFVSNPTEQDTAKSTDIWVPLRLTAPVHCSPEFFPEPVWGFGICATKALRLYWASKPQGRHRAHSQVARPLEPINSILLHNPSITCMQNWISLSPVSHTRILWMNRFSCLSVRPREMQISLLRTELYRI